MTNERKQKLCIGHLNVCSLRNKVTDVNVFVNSNGYHVFGLSETRLRPYITDDIVAVPNYSILRRDPTKPGETGVALYIHDSVQRFIQRRSDIELKSNIECLWIEVKPKSAGTLLICMLYRNPSSSFDWYDDFYNMFDYIDTQNNDVLLLGDFNIDMLKPHQSWTSTTTLLGLQQLVTAPTRVTASSATIIDHIYTNNHTAIEDANVAQVAISDHYATCCTWKSKLPKIKKNGHTCIQYRSYKHFNKDAFYKDLALTPFNHVYQITNPHEAFQHWHETFLNILNKHAPIRQKRVKHAFKPSWYTKEVEEAVKKKTKLKIEKRFQEFKTQCEYVKKLIKKSKKELFGKLIENDKNTSTLWRAINSITKGTNTTNVIPHFFTADMFNDHFATIADTLVPFTKRDEIQYCSKTLSSFCAEKTANVEPYTIPPLAVHEVGKLITSMKNKRSSGPDEISSTIVKHALPYIIDSLTYLYNLCIYNNTFPNTLKESKIIPIPKTKERSDINNYRPISLLSVFSKPLEKHVQKTLLYYLDKHGLIHPLQSGFRPGHSCHTALTHLLDNWLAALNASKITGAIFLDLKKAFDLVDHEILVNKLFLYTKSSQTTNFIRSYLSNRHQRVLSNGSYSSKAISHRGVPQGSILGPLLFSLFINDLPLHITNPDTSSELFADDGTVHCSDKSINNVTNQLQKGLSDIEKWCDNNAMVLNPNKTECMVLTTRQKHQRQTLCLQLTLQGSVIKQVNKHKLLGLIIDDRFQWESHINHLCKLLSRNIFLLRKLNTLTDSESKKMYFNAHIRSHIDYVSTTWDMCGDHHLKKISSLYRKAVKLILPNKHLSTDEKMKQLDILPLRDHLTYNKGVMMYKIVRNKVPNYIRHLFTESQVHPTEKCCRFILPKPRIDIFKTTLSFSGASLWNALPAKTTSASSLSSFKDKLFQYLIQRNTIT